MKPTKEPREKKPRVWKAWGAKHVDWTIYSPPLIYWTEPKSFTDEWVVVPITITERKP